MPTKQFRCVFNLYALDAALTQSELDDSWSINM